MIKLIDNINTTLADDLKQSLDANSRLKIAASYFSIYAYEALKKELENIDELQFLFTSPTFTTETATQHKLKENREFIIPKQKREKGIYGTEFEIHLKNKLTQKAIARECADWIKRKVRIKSNITQDWLPEFIVEQNTTDSLYTGIQGFTPIGLGQERGNTLANFVQKIQEPTIAQSYISKFNQIWTDPETIRDVTEEVIRHIESVYQENAPQRIYFLMLINIFKDFLENINEDVLPNDLTGYQNTLIWKKLFNFQKDAATGIINKLENFNGCILADSVGLGKTFTALAVIKYYELRNKSVLVLCPKKLSSNWTTYKGNRITNIFEKDRFRYDVLYHTDLSRTSGHTLDMNLSEINWGNYDLVVIDESHNFRNRDYFKDRETRYERLMNQVIRAGVKTKVLMLSATPVNNKFTDLKNQLALAYEGDPDQLAQKLDVSRDIETIFRRAQAAFNTWSTLPPERRTPKAILGTLDFDFFKLLDSVTIARSRKHIQTFYDTRDIGQFPTRLAPISIQSPLSHEEDTISMSTIASHLTDLKMAVYAPMNYILPSCMKKYADQFDTLVGHSRFKQVDREKSLQALMRINLLKRLESSVHSFRLTLQGIATNIANVLESIRNFEDNRQITDLKLSTELGFEEETEESNDFMIGGTLKIHLADMDIITWKDVLSQDLKTITSLINAIAPISPDKDTKLQNLKQHIINKRQNPINPGNGKVIIFTAFADTANYLYEHLSDFMLENYQVHSALITGSTNPKSTIKSRKNSREHYDMQGLLTLFSPLSKQKADIFPTEDRELDLLIATDCISEGQNLQDCDYLINYDIHWNPVRIIQRFGRVDRIGSKNEVIQLVNYWPDITLDEYIKLRERVEGRMVIVDVAATGDDNVLSSKANDIAYRHEQLKRLQHEVLDLEDTNTGVSITDLGLNDFRMDLLSYLEQYPNIKTLPSGLHTVIPANPSVGLVPGVIFLLRVRDIKLAPTTQNPLYPYYLVYISEQGEVVHTHQQAKNLLDLARQGCHHASQPIPEAYTPFNKRTKDGSHMQQYSEYLDIAINAIQESKAESDIASLFNGTQTTALEGNVSGLNDFELINFIVIEG
ncbi:helicase [Pelistega indica]|uniref:Helicase n=1 Tax=Pelistega indica TaxID=1414851 RepID=V8FUP9_9BURK|nr:helicase-related protein [Pelistega indica]ETD67885.1 helicase [Pelistega indica]